MRRLLSVLLMLAITLTLLCACSEKTEQPKEETESAVVFYVSPDGDDSGDGSEASPFATVSAARDAVRKLKSTSGLPAGGVTVKIKEGKYSVSEAIEFTVDDSGEKNNPIVYEGIGNVEISGGVVLNASDFEPASEEIKARITDETAKEKLLQIDLEKAGCTNIEVFEYDSSWCPNRLCHEFFAGYERQKVSRWPNEGYKLFCLMNGVSDGQVLTVSLSEEQSNAWAQSDNIMLYGFPCYDWSSCMKSVTEIDTENNMLVISDFGQGITSIGNFYVFHILEETDEPGEYYIDYNTSMMYYYPKDDFGSGELAMSQLTGSIVSGEACENVTFKNIAFEYSTENAVNMKSCAGISIENCIFRDIGGPAVVLNGSEFNVSGCEMYNLGTGGICVSNGDKSLTPTNTVIYNNHIHDWSQVYTVYNAAISLSGYGYTVSHNELHTSPHEAIAFNCGTTVIEYNNIYDVCKETSDAGAVYSGRRWDWGGNVIRHNYIHDIRDEVHLNGEPNAIYLDDALSYQQVYCNLIENVRGNGIKFGGKCVEVSRNLFINVSMGGLHTHDGVGWGAHETYNDGYMWSTLIDAGYLSDIWRYSFPENLLIAELTSSNYYENPDDPGTRAYTKMLGNVAIGKKIYNHYVTNSYMGNVFEIFGTMYENSEYKDAEAAGLNSDYTFNPDYGVARDQFIYPDIDFANIGTVK